MKLSTMTKEERSLLIFLESRAVDYGGLIDSRHMNQDDFDMAKIWKESGFINFGRICSDDIVELKKKGCKAPNNWVTLSEEAWKLAHKEREARHHRMHEKRSWKKTSEK